MKSEFCETGPEHSSIKKHLLSMIDVKIFETFEDIHKSRYSKMEDLHDLLLKRKTIGGLQHSFKHKFFKTLLEQELQQFNFIKTQDQYTLKVIKLTKCKLKDFKVDWRDIIGRLETSSKETNKLSGLYLFLRIVKDYYDQNNAMEVFNHFLGKYKFSDEITWFYLEHFVNLTKKTKPEIALELLRRLRDLYHYDDIKDICYYRWLLRVKKRLPQVSLGKYLDDLNNEVVNELILTQNNEKGVIKSVSSKFLVEILAKFIGKTNPRSVEIINWFFKIFESSFSAFEDSKTGIKILKNFLSPLWKRKTRQDALRKKLEKKDEQEEVDEKQKQKDDEDKQKEDTRDGLENMIGAFVLEADSDQDEDDDQIDESVPTEEKEQIRLEKLNALSADQLTPQIMEALKSGIQSILEDVFFASSKEGSKVLKYIYFLFPDLTQKSVQFVSKGMDITELNFGIHMKNTKKIIQYMFAFGNRETLMEYILTILAETSKIRYVKDAWNVICYLTMKIPLLDEDDSKLVSPQTKEDFLKNFKIDHDFFYQKYSEAVFQLFKRFLKQTEAKERKNLLRQDNPYLGMAFNSYPVFDKRVLEMVISNYIDSPNPFIYNYLELKNIPEKYIQNFLPQIKSNLSEEQIYTRFHQLLIVSKSLSFDKLAEVLNQIAQHDSAEHHMYLQQVLSEFVQNKILLRPKIKPIDSSLNYLLDQQTKYSMELQNTNLQSVEDSLQQLLSVWDQNYKAVSKFVQSHPKNIKAEVDLVQTVKRFYFETGNPDYQVRKEILWRLQLMECIIDKLPYQYLVWSQTPTLQQLVFKEFPKLKVVIDQAGQLVNDLLKIFLTEFPHQYKIISRLSSFALLFVGDDNLQLAMMQFKDIVKVIKANESVNYTNFYLSLFKQSAKFHVYAQAYHYLQRDRMQYDPLVPLIEVAYFHPDESEVGIVTKQQSFDMTDLIVKLLKTVPPAGLQDNKVKLFHSKLSKQLTALLDQPRNNLHPEKLVEILGLTMGFILSPERKIREGYLKALKNLLIILEDVKVDQKTLQKVNLILSLSSAKQKLIWAIGLVFLEDNITNFEKFYPMLNQLLFSDDFLLRKYSQFLLSYLIRSDRRKNAKVTVLQNLGQYKQKSLDEFLETGYLRPEHVDLNMKNKKVHMKYRSYDKCVIKEKFNQKESLPFIFDQDKALKFIQQYQTDQVSSEDEIMLKKRNLSSSSLSQLSDVFAWLKSRYSKVVSLAEHKFTSYESFFGQRFFKYIFEVDYENGFPFFNATKGFMENVCLPNLQTLDNQVVAINYISMLLKAYSKFYKRIPSQQVEVFMLKAMTEIIEKSSGNFFNIFRRLSLTSIDQLPFLVKFFQKYTPSNSGFYRTVEIRLSWFGHKREHLIEILKDIFKMGNNLHNNNVTKLMKQIIKFNQKHFFNQTQVQECGILNLQALRSKGEIIKETQTIYTASRSDFDQILVESLQRLIASEHIEDRKSGNQLLYNSIDTFLELQKTTHNITTLKRLLDMSVDIIISNKEEFKTDQSQFQDSLSLLLCQPYPQEQFAILLESIKRLLSPLPKISSYLKILYKNPFNFLQLGHKEYNQFIQQILKLIQNNLLFKEVLIALSGLLYFRKPQGFEEAIDQLGSNDRQVVTLRMSLLLSDVRHIVKHQKELNLILASKQKQKVKAWAKIMVNSRGKREVLESEESQRMWKPIIGVSNPYFYHA